MPRTLSVALLVAGLALPVVTCVLLGLGRLLGALGDEAGSRGLDRLALAAAILWALDLLALLFAVAFDQLRPRDDDSRR